MPGCGGIYRAPGHTISPPMGDYGYKQNVNCKWMIVAPAGHVVQLSFTSFHLESSNGCYFDSVTVFDGYVNDTHRQSRARPMGNFCGTSIPPVIISSGNVLSVVFTTDDSTTADGFLATYNFINGRNGWYSNRSIKLVLIISEPNLFE